MKRIFCLVALGVVAPLTLIAQIKEQTIDIVSGDCTLHGTLMIPNGDHATTVALIIAGSGPTDRDGNQAMMRNNSLKMVAQSLAQNGIASVRYDKRGIAGSRYPGFDQQNTCMTTYSNDVARWVSTLRRDRRFSNIILIGHSEGAVLALMAAHNGAKIDGVVTVAAMGRTADQLLKDQLSGQPAQIRDIAYEIIDTLKKGHIYQNVPVFLASLFTPSIQPFIISMMSLNPQELIRTLHIPILVIQGDTDVQIRVEDARLLAAANHDAKLVIIAGMNHVLKECPEADRIFQIPTYANPALPLHPSLGPTIARFIKDLEN